MKPAWRFLFSLISYSSFLKEIFFYRNLLFVLSKSSFLMAEDYQQSSPNASRSVTLAASFLVSCLLHFTRFLVEAPSPLLPYSA